MSFLPPLPLRTTQPSEDLAERMGYDCGWNGSDEINSHFSYFLTRELTAAWERGKKRAEDKRGSVGGGGA